MATTKKTQATDVNIHAADAARKALVTTYRNEPQVERSLSPLYADYLGKVVQISINGITIAFPVNGVTYKIPESFANEIDSRRMAIDATLNKAKRMSNITANSEKYAGELGMF